jgi:hypothetical protein
LELPKRVHRAMPYIERFKITLREQFFNTYEGNLTDIRGVEQDLKDYLLWYNTKRFIKV